MTVTHQLRVEYRRTPRAPHRARRRMRRAHDPSGLRGGRDRRPRQAQQQRGDAGGLRGQRQFAARHEIKLLCIAPDLHHDGAERIASERIRRRPQRAVDVGGAHGHH